MKLIHCSDLHLDSKMESNLSTEKARTRNNEIFMTFESMVQYALANSVSVILIAGDMFDTERISSGTLARILDLIRRADDIDFLYLRGNHDEVQYAFRRRDLPENLKFFTNRWVSYEYGDVVVTGIEFDETNSATLYQKLKLDPEKCNIVMMHGEISTAPGNGMVCVPQLRGRNIQYLALGHIHSYREAPLDLEGRYCYCGCLEGRGFDECGPKGFVLLETVGKKVTSTFLPAARRTFHEISVDITGLETYPELRDAVLNAVQGIDEKDLVKIVLRGTYTLTTQKDLAYLLQYLNQRFFFAKIKDESELNIPDEEYVHDISLKGAFLRAVKAANEDSETKAQMIRCGIQALRGEEIDL